tara:strand:- start:2675 stop:2926 length:252 start_codon:yes stop_codon:yes gene_type:complete
MKVREVVWPVFFFWSKWVEAIVLYPFIIYKSEKAVEHHRKHELIHVEQVRRLGWLRFYTSYLYESYKNGYYNNKYEVEARERS